MISREIIARNAKAFVYTISLFISLIALGYSIFAFGNVVYDLGNAWLFAGHPDPAEFLFYIRACVLSYLVCQISLFIHKRISKVFLPQDAEE